MIMELGDAVVSSNRRALAKAITLIESDKHEHQKQVRHPQTTHATPAAFYITQLALAC